MSGAAATAATQEEDKKPTDQSAHINLKVKGQVVSSLTVSLSLSRSFNLCISFIFLEFGGFSV